MIVGEKLEKAKEKGLRLQAIKIESPKLIESVDYWVLPFAQRDLDRPQASQVRLPYWANLYAASYGPFNNLFFYKYDGSDAHLLFDRKLLIAMFAFPTTEKGRFIYYLVVEEDTNNDGRVYMDDKQHLYLSDLTGKNLRRLEFSHGQVNYVFPEMKTGDLIISVTEDTNQDGQLTEADFDLLKRLNVNTGDLTDIVDADLVRRVQEIAFQ